MATVHANKILTKFMLLLGGHNHCVKVSSDSETVRGMGLWEFSGALRELMLTFISKINTTSERLKARNFFICQYFSFYEQLKLCAQLS